VIGAYDTYGKKFFDKDFLSSIKELDNSSGEKLSYIEINENHFDYIKLKLFLLSVLWRASISKLDFFSSVQLGKYEDVIKNMLLQTHLTDENIFQIVLATRLPHEHGYYYGQTIIPPQKRKYGSTTVYEFVFGDLEIHFKVGKGVTDFHIEGLNISPNKFIIIVMNFESSILGKVINKIKTKTRKGK